MWCPRIIRRERVIKRGSLTKLERVPMRCGGALEFVGIAPRSRQFGWRRWDQCRECRIFVASDTTGMIRVMQKDEPPKHIFPSLGLVRLDEVGRAA